MDFFEVVNRRGSYRDKFEQKAVPDKDIRKILSCNSMTILIQIMTTKGEYMKYVCVYILNLKHYACMWLNLKHFN